MTIRYRSPRALMNKHLMLFWEITFQLEVFLSSGCHITYNAPVDFLIVYPECLSSVWMMLLDLFPGSAILAPNNLGKLNKKPPKRSISMRLSKASDLNASVITL